MPWREPRTPDGACQTPEPKVITGTITAWHTRRALPTLPPHLQADGAEGASVSVVVIRIALHLLWIYGCHRSQSDLRAFYYATTCLPPSHTHPTLPYTTLHLLLAAGGPRTFSAGDPRRACDWPAVVRAIPSADLARDWGDPLAAPTRARARFLGAPAAVSGRSIAFVAADGCIAKVVFHGRGAG